MTQSIFEMLRNAVVQYGYWAVGGALLLENAGIPVPGETILLLASFLAYSQHELRLPWIIAVATIAATLGDNLGFALGYYGGGAIGATAGGKLGFPFGFFGGGPPVLRYQSIFRIKNATITRGEELFAK